MPKRYPLIAGYRILERDGIYLRVSHPATGQQAVLEWHEGQHLVIGDKCPPVCPAAPATAAGIEEVADWRSPKAARRRFAGITCGIGW